MNKNPELLQGKINYLTKRKDVEISNSSGKFTKAGAKNSHKDTIYAKGAIARVPDTSDDEDETTQPPKPKKAKKSAQAGNVVKINNTATVSNQQNAMTFSNAETAQQASSQQPSNGNSVPSATEIEDRKTTNRSSSQR